MDGAAELPAPVPGCDKWFLAQYVAVFQWGHNVKRATDDFLRALLGLMSQCRIRRLQFDVSEAPHEHDYAHDSELGSAVDRPRGGASRPMGWSAKRCGSVRSCGCRSRSSWEWPAFGPSSRGPWHSQRRKYLGSSSVQVRADGSLEGFDAARCQEGAAQGGEAGVVVVAQLLGLLVTFIGEPLTLRLVRDAWPDAPVDETDRRAEGQP